MKKRFLCLLMAFALVASLAVPAMADFDTETRNSIAVVYTCLDMDSGDYGFGWGTGFFVGKTGEAPQYLVTNWHVIEDFLDYGAGDLVDVDIDGKMMTGRSKIRVYYDSGDFEEAYVVDYDEQKDVAVLRLAAPTNKRSPMKLTSPDDSMVGSQIFAVGYPDLAENIFAGATTSWGESDASVTSGTISRIFTTEGTGQVNIQIDCVIRHGNSGGPVVNGNGAALGIATWGVSDEDEDVYYAISIDEAIPILRMHDVEFETVEAGGSSPGGDASSSSAAEPANSGGSGLFLILGIAAVAAVAVVLIIVFMRKKKTSSADAKQVPGPQQKVPVVRSFSAQHSGRSVPVRDGQMVIGRVRNECGIVFAEGTPGVSARHCSVSFDNGTGCFTLTDLGSTYGTFLENGQRLNPGVPCQLRTGDRFYLGDKANMMTVGLE